LRRSGADDYLAKPLQIERLLAAVDNVTLPDGDRGARAEDDLPDGPLQPEVVQNLRDLYPDGEALREFIDLFLSDSPPRLDRLVEAVRAGDVDEVWQGAHALRGSCVLVGAHRVKTLLEGFEEVVRRGDLPGEAEIEAIQAAYAEAAEALARELGAA
jgi:HPt (histidine-containing phosphotransfer) domain-containing protein